MKKLVYFHPKLFYPPLTGGDVSSFEFIKALKELGYTIYLFVIEREGRKIVYKDNWGAERLEICQKDLPQKVIRDKFSSYIEEIKAEVIFMNYPSWDFVLDHNRFKHIKRVIYNQDFEFLARRMNKRFIKHWNIHEPKNIEQVPQKLISKSFFKAELKKIDLAEFQSYDNYDYTLAIDDYGADKISQNSLMTKVIKTPATLSSTTIVSKQSHPAMMALTPIPFNLQGYCFFLKKILPKIVKKYPFFRVSLFGLSSYSFFNHPNVISKGHVPDFELELSKTKMLLCPTFSGLGQQMKILQAMRFAIPIVAMHNPLQHMPLTHGVTGYIAQSAKEFADYTLKLEVDEALRKEMGQRAKEHFDKDYSMDRLLKTLRLANF